jgi:hypothetical protein
MRSVLKSKFEKVALGQLQLREGGGCISLFGLPFLLAGIFTALVGVGIIPVENESDFPFWSRLIIISMGLIFTCVGGVLVFGRRWITLDSSRGAIVKYWGLVVPMKQTELSVHMYDSVLIKFQAGDSDSADVYIVALRAKDGSKDLDLYSSAQYGTSHEQALIVSDFLGFPVIDSSTEHESVIDSHLADAAYHDVTEHERETVTYVSRPPVLLSQVQESADEVQIIIPDKSFKAVRIIRYMLPALILIFIVPQFGSFFKNTNTPDIIEYIFLFVAILFFGIIPLIGLMLSIIRSRRNRTIVTANADGTKIESCGILQTKTKHIPRSDILGMDYSTTESIIGSVRKSMANRNVQGQNVDYSSIGYSGSTPRWVNILQRFVKSKGIIIKSRNGLITFGAGLPDEEVQYLFSIVKKALGLH